MKYFKNPKSVCKNSLVMSDCLTTLKHLPDKSIKLCVTSPPSNMRLKVVKNKYKQMPLARGNHFSTKYGDFDDALSLEDFEQFHSKVIRELLRTTSIIVYNIQIVAGSKEAFFRMIGTFSKEIKDIIIWDKNFGQPSMNPGCINKASELLLILESDGKIGRTLTNYEFERGTLSDIWRIKRDKSIVKGHGAVFPLELVKKAITCFSKIGDTVIDPFMGTGTTGVASKLCGRDFIGIEQSEEFFKVAKKRIQMQGNSLWK